jgi:hypothetical protein
MYQWLRPYITTMYGHMSHTKRQPMYMILSKNAVLKTLNCYFFKCGWRLRKNLRASLCLTFLTFSENTLDNSPALIIFTTVHHLLVSISGEKWLAGWVRGTATKAKSNEGHCDTDEATKETHSEDSEEVRKFLGVQPWLLHQYRSDPRYFSLSSQCLSLSQPAISRLKWIQVNDAR